MHWWQILIRLILVANSLGNFSDLLTAGRNRQWGRLHWLLPKAIGWTVLFFALLPARWGGIGKNHWEIAAWSSLVLLGYGLIIEMTDVSRPQLPWFSIELPHSGIRLGIEHMVFVAVFGFLSVGWNIFQSRRVSSKDEIFLIIFTMALILGVRLFLRQYALTRLIDLIELMKPKQPAPKKQPDKYWMKSTDE